MLKMWSTLSSDLVSLIAENLTTDMADYVRFRAVCTGWRSSTVEPCRRRHPPQLPWLIVDYNKKDNVLHFRSSDAKHHSMLLPDNIVGKMVCGSYNGWLILDDPNTLIISLLNPITRVEVELPTLLSLHKVKDMHEDGKNRLVQRIEEKDFKLILVNSVATTTRPDSCDGCTFVLTFSTVPIMVSWRTGDSSWRVVDDDNYYSDVIYSQNRFFAVTKGLETMVFDLGFHKVASVEFQATLNVNIPVGPSWRLVESSGKLLMFQCFSKNNIGKKRGPRNCWTKVDAFVLSIKNGTYQWLELKNLGDEIFFVARTGRPISLHIDNCPFAKHDNIYLSREYLQHGIQSNNVYRIKSGVYNLKDGRVTEDLPYVVNLGKNHKLFAFKWHSPYFY